MNTVRRILIAMLAITLLAMPTTNVHANPAGKRISHATCTEVLVVEPQAPKGLAGTTVQLDVDGPNGFATITLTWQGYNGPTAKWVGSAPDLGNGIYTFSGVDNSLTTTLNCWATPTPTLEPSKTPTLVPTNTSTSVPTGTFTSVPTNTGVPSATSTLDAPTATRTSDPTETATAIPSPTPTIGVTATQPSDEGSPTATNVVEGTPTTTPLAPPTTVRIGPVCGQFINPNGLLNQNMVSNWPVLFQTLTESRMLQQNSNGFWFCVRTVNKPPSTGADFQSVLDWFWSLFLG